MALVSADRISKRYNDQTVFEQVSLAIQPGQRIGLVGRNGSGKTTLFDLLVGITTPDSGTITRARNIHIDYIRQEIAEELDRSLFEYVASARADLLEVRHQLHGLEHDLEANPHDSTRLAQLGQLQSRFESQGGFVFESEVRIILEGLGFTESRHQERLRNFSGGEKNRAGLARALAGNGSVLLLDEPTNHLDIESTVWLEEHLSRSDRTYIVVSHDRAFLTATVDRVWEIIHGKLDIYIGGFRKYLDERAERRRRHQHRYKHQQEEIKRLEEFVRRHMAGQKTKQAQSKLKYLNRIKRLAPLQSDHADINISMQSSGRSYDHVLAVEHLAIGYGDRMVIEEATFDVYRGDKIGLIGCNGSGKSSLLRALIGELAPISGEIRLGANVEVAYFDQELADLDPDSTVLDSLWELDSAAEVGRIRSFLARFGFTGEDCFKPIPALSGGEKTKLSLARILYHPANFIIFDEPTNHLDLDSREVLESALQEYDGSCLIVSHDRQLLDQVVDRILHVEGGLVRTFNGNYSYFREKTALVPEAIQMKPASQKEAYMAFKEKSKRIAKLKRLIQSTKSRIADLERELMQLEQDIESNIPRSDWEKLQQASDRKRVVEEQILEQYATLEQLETTRID